MNGQGNRIINCIQTMKPTRLISLGYGIIILLGTLLLSLPIATRAPGHAPLEDAFFTATSATCVTGLILHDTYQYWTLFGQMVLLVLIQLGGLGFMTIAITLLTLTKRKIGLRQRFTMQESLGAPQVGGIVRMTKFIFFGALGIELLGAGSLMIYFCPKIGLLRGFYFSVFHSVSAFCNAGFDLMGAFSPDSSLMTVSDNLLFNVTIMALIVVGGLGFFVWADVIEHRHRLGAYRLHTKIVLTTTVLLILLGTAGFFLLEESGAAMEGHSLPSKLLASAFQSVSARTAGFCTINLADMSESGQFLMVVLMLIGGSPGSTAGGLKTTTFAVLFLSILIVFQKKKSIECYRRRIEEETIHNACCVFMLYLFLAVGAAIGISRGNQIPLVTALFETASAVGTVGLTLGVTPALGTASHIVLALLMFIGRIGGITILLAFNTKASAPASQYPVEKITVG